MLNFKIGSKMCNRQTNRLVDALLCLYFLNAYCFLNSRICDFSVNRLFLKFDFYTFQDLESQFNCVVPFIPPISRDNHYDICLNKTENEIEKVMALFVKSASNTTKGACMLPCASMEVKNFIDWLVRADWTKFIMTEVFSLRLVQLESMYTYLCLFQ